MLGVCRPFLYHSRAFTRSCGLYVQSEYDIHEGMDPNFEILTEIEDVGTIAVGPSIRDMQRLKRAYGYEAHGIGRKECKRKKYLD